jgi:hypothetical protein
MRFVPLFACALLLTGCGASMAEQPAAETNTARILVAWDGDAREGVFDLRDGTGVVERSILTADAVYEPIDEELIGNGKKRWLKSPREYWDPLFMEPIADGPQRLLTFLRSADWGEPTTEGMERGEPVTYYAATVRMDEFMAQANLTPAEREEVSDVSAEWDGLTFQLAVDGDDRIRRADFAFGDDSNLRIEIYDYGVEVNAVAPDPRTVIEWEDYEKLLRAECERLKKKGLEKTKPHCFSCGATEGEEVA